MRKSIVILIAVLIYLAFASVPRAKAQEAGTQATGQRSSQAQNNEPPALLEIVRESIKEGRTAAHEKWNPNSNSQVAK